MITANAVVANPDFDQIRAADKKKYHNELITETYKKYPHHKGVLKMWKDSGIEEKLLYPQYHGREHLNVDFWMRVINSEAFSEKLSFDNDCILGINVPGEPVQIFNYMAAFEYDTIEQQRRIEDITVEGLKIFEEIFGLKSKSFVASCSIQGQHLDRILYDGGVDYHQLGHQLIPLGKGEYKAVDRLWGQRNSLGQTYWRRNCMFEPSRNQNYDWVNNCLQEVKIAFRWGKPAVINSHRVNFIGGIFEENRVESLKKLSELVSSIVKKWPEVEFLTSAELGDVIAGK